MKSIRKAFEKDRAEHDAKKAQRAAESADEDAEFAIEYASAAVEEAEYAVLDAELAHKEADELAERTRNRLTQSFTTGLPARGGPSALQRKRETMIEVILFAVFFGGITIGALIADKLGKLPSADELEARGSGAMGQVRSSSR